MTRMIQWMSIGLLFAAAVPSLADCLDGVRKASPRESEHYARVFAQLRDALPPPPAGWTMAPVQDRAFGSTCKETREGDVWIDVGTVYTYQMPKDQADRNVAEIRRLTAEVEALEKLPPEVAKERQAWMDKYSEATRAARQADKEGNRESAKQKYAERDEYDRQASGVRARYLESVQPQVKPLRARIAELDTSPILVRVHMVANDRGQVPSDRSNVSEIVVGTIPPSGSRPPFRVAGVHVLLEGPAPQRETIARAFDKAKLQQPLH